MSRIKQMVPEQLQVVHGSRQSRTSLDAPIPYELRVGVTGHRDLADPRAVAQAVDRVLNHVEETLATASAEPYGPAGSPHSRREVALTYAARVFSWLFWLPSRVPGLDLLFPPIPTARRKTPPERRTRVEWSVVTSLAEGADRIVAEVVCRRVEARGDCTARYRYLEAVLPMPADQYQQEFNAPDDAQQFDKMVAKDQCPLVMYPSFPQDELGRSIERHNAYTAAGRAVVDSSEFVIAVWNGEPAEGSGGTAEAVEFAINRGRAVIWIHSVEPSRQPRLLVQQNRANATRGPLPGMWHVELPTRAKDLSPNFHRLAAYNRDAAFDLPACRQIYEERNVRLRTLAADVGLPTDIAEELADRLLPHYARASQLADSYQRLYRLSAKGLPILSAAAVTLVAVQLLFFPDWYRVIWAEFVMVLLAWLGFKVAQNEAWHQKWLNDRHLAERLRALTHTVLLGSRRPLARVHPERALPFYDPPHAWFAGVFDREAHRVQRAVGGRAQSPELLGPVRDFIIGGWLETQALWQREVGSAKHKMARTAELVGTGFVLAILLAAGLHAWGLGHHEHGPGTEPSLWQIELWIACLALVLPAWAAASHTIETLMDYERLAERAERMTTRLNQVISEARRVETFDDLRRVVNQAEEVIATENHEWLATLRFRRPVFHG